MVFVRVALTAATHIPNGRGGLIAKRRGVGVTGMTAIYRRRLLECTPVRYTPPFGRLCVAQIVAAAARPTSLVST
jgi:hypothetical protein